MALLWFQRDIPAWLVAVADAIGEPVAAFDPRSVTTRGEPVVLVVDTRGGDATALCKSARTGFGASVVIAAITGGEPLDGEAMQYVDVQTPAVSHTVRPVLELALRLASERQRRTFVERLLARARPAAPAAADDDLVRQKEHESRELLDALPEGALVERQGRIVFANATAASMLGLPIADLLGQSVLDHVHTEDRKVVEDHVLSIGAPLATSAQKAREVRITRNDGTTTIAEMTALLIHFGGEPSTFVIVRDVTERKLLEGIMATSDRLSSMGVLAAGVAHEINNPLTALVSSLDFLDEEAELHPELAQNADISDLLLTAKEASYRIRDIIRDLRLFSRPDEERRGLVDLRATLDSTCRLARVEIRHRARLVKNFGPTPLVDGNEARLGQVFLNLVMNAAQAIGEGDVDGNEIALGTFADADGNAVVEVRDTGRGIPQQLIDRVFEPFFTTKPIGVGTGLGLSISRRIVEEAGGHITVTSGVGQGTLVRVVLPPAAPKAAIIANRAGPLGAKLSSRGRVLVVDDDIAVRRALIRILGTEHDITTVSSGAEAIDTIASGERFDVVLCDLMMPKVTGDRCYLRVLDMAKEQAARFVFMSGGAFTSSAREFLETTPHPKLEKPFDIELLRKTVRDVMETARTT